jgi:hypothetical protein
VSCINTNSEFTEVGELGPIVHYCNESREEQLIHRNLNVLIENQALAKNEGRIRIMKYRIC